MSHSGEILDLGVNLGIISKSGSWFSYDGTKLGQGRDAVKRLIGDNPELAEELEAKSRQNFSIRMMPTTARNRPTLRQQNKKHKKQ